MEFAVALIVLVALVAATVAVPLRRRGAVERRDEARLAELQAAKEAKYREIRDAELDHRMGKLSADDWRGRWTASCAARRSRSSVSSTGWRAGRPTTSSNLPRRWKRF